MRVIAVEEHWTTAQIDETLRRQPAERADPSLALNDRADIRSRLLDLEDLRIAAMDAAGVDMQILSIAPPGTNGLPAGDAAALSREANDRASAAVRRFPERLRTLTTLPFSDPEAAIEELERTEDLAGHVGVMAYGRCADRPLDHPDFDELLGVAARLRRPILIHPQVPPAAVRDASYSGLAPTLNLSLATFGWGWHIEAGLAALRLIVSGAFDRHPGLQIVLGHWGEMLLFAVDRIDSLSNLTLELERRVAEYFPTNVYITPSGMMIPRLLSHTLDFIGIDRILLSGDYPFHQVTAKEVNDLLGTLPSACDRDKVAHANAEHLFAIG